MNREVFQEIYLKILPTLPEHLTVKPEHRRRTRRDKAVSIHLESGREAYSLLLIFYSNVTLPHDNIRIETRRTLL